MSRMIINGKNPLSGEIKVSGAKNSAVALIPTAVLAKTKTVIYNVPEISDIEYLIQIMEMLNCKIEHKDETLYIDSSNLINKPIPEELSVQMRASYYYMGALLAKFHRVEISFPGGCNIGARPIYIHIKGFEELGAKVEIIKNRYIITAEKLVGKKIYFDFPSVGATINVMLAAMGAEGTTVIENAAMEPEIVNVASFLMNMGAKIRGAGTKKIEIEGNNNLDNGIIEVFPDRIEAGTYVIIGALLGSPLKINGVIKEHIEALLMKLKEIGVEYTLVKDSVIVNKCENIKPTNIKTLVFPGFPTDLQQPMTTLLTQAQGKSIVEETLYENRFQNTYDLNNMGALTSIISMSKLEIDGPRVLKGKNVIARDLRGGASLLIAGLIAEGVTKIDNCEVILRGYGDVVNKLNSAGAKIEIIE
ncbi:MAG: UDP-N-acetylglucosamine 1-carboxyvinyltransferase [Tenericutes bacterium]|nr:UDP-N-acetylglucosamine 1-carboxyvinyltransferase [Mycoplasmatota bacterium]